VSGPTADGFPLSRAPFALLRRDGALPCWGKANSIPASAGVLFSRSQTVPNCLRVIPLWIFTVRSRPEDRRRVSVGYRTVPPPDGKERV
jgi:hypothetical protein